MNSQFLKIILDGKDDEIRVADFIGTLRNTLSTLNSIKNVHGWKIGIISHSSPAQVEFVNDSTDADKVCNWFFHGLETIEKEERKPEAFGISTIENLQKLIKPLSGNVTKLSYEFNGSSFNISKKFESSLNKLLDESDHYFLNTELEGVLYQVTVDKHKSEFCISDRVTGKKTKCFFKKDEAEKVGSILTHRIRVYGNAKFSKLHHPISIEVEKWDGPIGEDAPSISELHKAKFKITTGEESQHIIRKLRDVEAKRSNSLG